MTEFVGVPGSNRIGGVNWRTGPASELIEPRERQQTGSDGDQEEGEEAQGRVLVLEPGPGGWPLIYRICPSRAALNSLLGFHWGGRRVSARRHAMSWISRRSSTAPLRSQSGFTSSLTLW